MVCGKDVDKTASGFVPEYRAARIPIPAFQNQFAAKIQKKLVMAAETANQGRFKGSAFGSGKREFVWSNRYDDGIDVLIGIGTGIQSRGEDRQ